MAELNKDDIKSLVSLTSQLNATMQSIAKSSGVINNSFIGLNSLGKDILTNEDKILKSKNITNSILRNNTSELKNMNSILKDQLKDQLSIQKITDNKVTTAIKQGQSQIVINELLRESQKEHKNTNILIRESLKFQQKSTDEWNKNLDIQKEYKGELQKHFETLNSIYKTSKDAASSTKASLLIAAVGVTDLVKRFYNLAQTVSNDLNVPLDTSVKLMKDFTAEAGLGVMKTEDIAKSFAGLSQAQYGNLDISMKTADNIARMATEFHLTEEESAKITYNLSSLPGSTETSANNMGLLAKKMGEIYKVSPGQIMKNMSAALQSGAIFSKDMGANLISASVAAGAMGVNVNGMVTAAEKLLDFESSITDEMNLAVLSGRNINLEGARSAAWRGDLVGMATQLAEQFKGMEDSNPIVRKSMQSLGLSIQDISRITQNKDKITQMSQSEQLQLMEQIKAGNYEMLDGLQKIDKAGKTTWESFSSWGKIGLGVLLGINNALQLTGALSNLSGGKLGKLMSGGVGTTSGTGSGGVGGMLKGISATSMLQSAAAMAIFAGSIWIMAKSFQELEKVNIKEVIGPLAAVGATMLAFSVIATLGSEGLLIGAAGLLAIGGATMLMGAGFKLLAEGSVIFGDFLKNIDATTIGNIFSFAGALAVLSGSIALMAVSLTALGVAGVVALPVLAAVGVGAAVGSYIGSSTSGGSTETNNSDIGKLADRVNALINVLEKEKEISIYLDKQKVGNGMYRELSTRTKIS